MAKNTTLRDRIINANLLENEYQEKFLSSDVTNATLGGNGGTLSDLTFNNLEIGRTYRVFLQAKITAGGTDFTGVRIKHDSNIIGTVGHRNSGGGVDTPAYGSTNVVFEATTTTVIFDAFSVDDANSIIEGDNNFDATWARIEPEFAMKEVSTH